MTDAMNTPQIPTPEAGDTLGDKIPSSSPSARESASKRSIHGTSPSGLDDEIQPSRSVPRCPLTSVSRDRAVTADVTESPEGDAEPDRPAAQQAAPSHPPGNRRANAASTAQVDAMPRWLRRQIEQDLPRIAEAYVPPPKADFVPSILRRPENADLLRQAGMVVTPPVTRASGAHLEPVGLHELDDDAKIPRFLRRQGVTSLATHAQPIASDREPSEGSQADQPSRFVPRVVLRDRQVTSLVTPSQASPVVTPDATGAPVAGSICPTCNCRVPARLSSAERQRAYRARKREQGQGVAKGD
jgi:hypothetical protein